MDKLERYANGWSKAEMDAFNIVMTDPAMPDYKSPDYDDWLFHKAWQAALAAAPTPPAQDREVGILYVSIFRGHLENFHFDYYGDLPEGSHALYAAPQSDKIRQAAEEALEVLEDYHASETNIAETIKNLRAALEGK
jgi:hypothetical protein